MPDYIQLYVHVQYIHQVHVQYIHQVHVQYIHQVHVHVHVDDFLKFSVTN